MVPRGLSRLLFVSRFSFLLGSLARYGRVEQSVQDALFLVAVLGILGIHRDR